ncbi:MAG: RsmE family RNA methyltransferase [Polyangiales bacterium]
MSGQVRRLHAPDLPAAGGDLVLPGDVARHARTVLRLLVGDRVRLFDGNGREADATLLEVGAETVRCRADAPVEVDAEVARITLIQCLPKGSKIDDIVRMATELGVHAIHLATSERSVPVLGDRAARRTERLSRIAQEAARQSGRATIPEVIEPRPLRDVTAAVPKAHARLVFWEMHRGGADVPAEAKDLALVIGPEGGLSEGEVAPLVDDGWSLAGLGPTVLRVETAGPVAVAVVRDRLGRGPGF